MAGGNRAITTDTTQGGVVGTTPTGSHFTIPTVQSKRKKQPVGLVGMIDKPYNRGSTDNNDEKK